MQNLIQNVRCDAPLLQLLSVPNLRNVEPKVPNLPMENIAMQLGSVWCTKLCDDAVLCSARPILRFFNMRQMHKNLYHISHTTTDAPNSFPPFCIRMMHGDIYVSSHANCQTRIYHILKNSTHHSVISDPIILYILLQNDWEIHLLS